jgi:hypothetical protein
MLPPKVSLALMAVDNATGEVRASCRRAGLF